MTPKQLRVLGESLYGQHWQTPMAHALQCSTRAIRRWLSGKRQISEITALAIQSLQSNTNAALTKGARR
jgi:hypothetical protein